MVNFTIVSEMHVKYSRNVTLSYLKINLIKNEFHKYDSIIERNSDICSRNKTRSIVYQWSLKTLFDQMLVRNLVVYWYSKITRYPLKFQLPWDMQTTACETNVRTEKLRLVSKYFELSFHKYFISHICNLQTTKKLCFESLLI